MQDFRYPKQCYLILKSLDDCNRITWATRVRNLLCRYGFGYVWVAQGVGDMNSLLEYVVLLMTLILVINA